MRPPARCTGPAESHRPAIAEEHHRQAYYAVLDRPGSELRDRFSWQRPERQSLESMVRGKELGEDFVRTYAELSVDRLKVELNMFRSEHGKLEHMKDLVEALRSLHPANIRLFNPRSTGVVIHSPLPFFFLDICKTNETINAKLTVPFGPSILQTPYVQLKFRTFYRLAANDNRVTSCPGDFDVNVENSFQNIFVLSKKEHMF